MVLEMDCPTKPVVYYTFLCEKLISLQLTVGNECVYLSQEMRDVTQSLEINIIIGNKKLLFDTIGLTDNP